MVYFDTEERAFKPIKESAMKYISGNKVALPWGTYVIMSTEEYNAFYASRPKRARLQVRDDGYPEWLEIQTTAEEYRVKYEKAVDSKIREKYTVSQELSILRQRDSKPDEYATYNTYCEQCKTIARAEIYGDKT